MNSDVLSVNYVNSPEIVMYWEGCYRSAPEVITPYFILAYNQHFCQNDREAEDETKFQLYLLGSAKHL